MIDNYEKALKTYKELERVESLQQQYWEAMMFEENKKQRKIFRKKRKVKNVDSQNEKKHDPSSR